MPDPAALQPQWRSSPRLRWRQAAAVRRSQPTTMSMTSWAVIGFTSGRMEGEHALEENHLVRQLRNCRGAGTVDAKSELRLAGHAGRGCGYLGSVAVRHLSG